MKNHQIFHSKDGKIKELKEHTEKGKKPFKYEKIIQELIENNLNNVFPELEFVKTEHQMGKLRPDSIAFNNESNSFVIIEYKNVRNHGVVDQGLSYYRLLQENKGDFILLYHEIKDKLLKMDEVNWDETRVIFISPEYNIHQRRASGVLDLPIDLYEISKHEGDLITLHKIKTESDDSRTYKKKLKQRTHVPLADYSEEDYLEGKYETQMPSEITKQLYFKLKNEILTSFPLIEFKQKKKYAGFYSSEDDSSICSLEVGKNKIKVVYSTVKKDLLPKSDFIQDVSKIGHWGVGHFRSEINKELDIPKVISLIKLIYADKVKSDDSVIDGTFL